MNRVAQLSPAEHRELFQETATRRGVSAAVIEKDFWVCWVLKQLFADAVLGTRLVFKGGTSLSKVYNLIDRFSEDIDLILDWRLLGYGPDQPDQEDPYQDFTSNTQQDRFNKEVNARAARYIADTLINDLNRLFAHVADVSTTIDSDDPQTVNVTYPAAFSEEYLRPDVRLEIGPLAAWSPSGRHTIRPYAAESFPQVFDDPACPVVVMSAERSFWEKATILHQQAHRTTPMPPRYSRHYYDLHKLAGSPVRDAALRNLPLLQDVASFKRRFYPSAWASYETAWPGSLKLIPGTEHLTSLRRDYSDMAMMIFGEAPAFNLIVDSLQQLEDQINQHDV